MDCALRVSKLYFGKSTWINKSPSSVKVNSNELLLSISKGISFPNSMAFFSENVIINR